MIKHSAAAAAFVSILITVIGCGWNPLESTPTNGPAPVNSGRQANANVNANRSITDIAVDSAVGQQSTGVPECDEVMDLLTTYANNPEDNFAVRAAKGVFVSKMKETIRQNLEQQQVDKAELAKVCREAKTEIQKAQAPAN